VLDGLALPVVQPISRATPGSRSACILALPKERKFAPRRRPQALAADDEHGVRTERRIVQTREERGLRSRAPPIKLSELQCRDCV
jgi:hypothetical protein